MYVEMKNIYKKYGDFLASDNVSFGVEKGKLVALLGPSGSGKTTLLRMIAGLEDISDGELWIGDKLVNYLEPKERNLAMVFQSYALYPQMNIYDNIAFSLQVRKVPKKEIDKKVHHVAELLGLENLLKQRPKNLSGGQRQRVAIGNAIIREPKVLLMDEPLSNLDAKLRTQMRVELAGIHKALGNTIIYVTHDQEEALTMSDTIVVMNQGYIQQVGTPEDIYNEPKNAFVADFIGDSNILSATMVHDRLVNILGANFPCVDEGFGQKKPVDAVIRPEDIDLVKPEDGIIRGVVTHVIFKGVHYEMEVMANNYEWLVHSTDMFPVGAEVGLRVDPFDIQIMKKPESEDEEAVPIEE